MNDHVLRDVPVGDEVAVATTNVDAHRPACKFCGELLHFPGPRGREHERLPARTGFGHRLHHLAQLRLKAHIEHAICLIEHQEPDRVHREHAHLDEVT